MYVSFPVSCTQYLHVFPYSIPLHPVQHFQGRKHYSSWFTRNPFGTETYFSFFFLFLIKKMSNCIPVTATLFSWEFLAHDLTVCHLSEPFPITQPKLGTAVMQWASLYCVQVKTTWAVRWTAGGWRRDRYSNPHVPISATAWGEGWPACPCAAMICRGLLITAPTLSWWDHRGAAAESGCVMARTTAFPQIHQQVMGLIYKAKPKWLETHFNTLVCC